MREAREGASRCGKVAGGHERAREGVGRWWEGVGVTGGHVRVCRGARWGKKVKRGRKSVRGGMRRREWRKKVVGGWGEVGANKHEGLGVKGYARGFKEHFWGSIELFLELDIGPEALGHRLEARWRRAGGALAVWRRLPGPGTEEAPRGCSETAYCHQRVLPEVLEPDLSTIYYLLYLYFSTTQSRFVQETKIKTKAANDKDKITRSMPIVLLCSSSCKFMLVKSRNKASSPPPQ
ncbi:hypothetical protein BV22DRAFT_1052461 [Leucogyrophana mollusca]|uniref:Uncharacterized protein n=1 Tax=Leucogyrophana mollusca TaxID=85980 RepID=A0ACB8AWF4_9AGAM|nr:hypothetical protein BV22DRAFT_1052461 [Leucogyrophana mollusca]